MNDLLIGQEGGSYFRDAWDGLIDPSEMEKQYTDSLNNNPSIVNGQSYRAIGTVVSPGDVGYSISGPTQSFISNPPTRTYTPVSGGWNVVDNPPKTDSFLSSVASTVGNWFNGNKRAQPYPVAVTPANPLANWLPFRSAGAQPAGNAGYYQAQTTTDYTTYIVIGVILLAVVFAINAFRR